MASYTTAALVEAELRATESFGAGTNPTLDTVNEWIQEESAYINDLGQRIYGTDTKTIYLDYNGEEEIYLDVAPLISIDSFEYNTADADRGQTESLVSKTEGTDFIVKSDLGKIKFTTQFNPVMGSNKFKITLTYGYASTPLSVQMLCTKLVTDRVLSSLLNDNMNQGNSGGSISVGSINIVEPADFGMGSYNRLQDDVANLKKELINSTSLYRY